MAVPKRVPADATYPHFLRQEQASCLEFGQASTAFLYLDLQIPSRLCSPALHTALDAVAACSPEKGRVASIVRSRRFDSARLSVNVGLACACSHTFPIDVTPLQAEYFANPKSHAHSNNAHRSKRFWDVLQYLQELIYRENSRLPHSFRTVFHKHEAHWVELIWDQLPAHRGVIQNAHQILEMGLAFRR